MDPATRQKTLTVSTKLPPSVVAEIDRIALYRGVSRSFLMRELAEAAIAGRVTLSLPPGRHGLTFRDLAASDVGRAARKRALDVAAAACRGEPTPRDTDAAAEDADAAARETARQIAMGLER